jgi:hypothetical protein
MLVTQPLWPLSTPRSVSVSAIVRWKNEKDQMELAEAIGALPP